MEYLDIYDENGNFLGKEERKIVHRDALWHNTVHCWLYDREGNVYFQIRKDKEKMYTTASGHVKAGETIKEAFGREIKEEIGYKVDYNKAKLIEINKFVMDREEEDGSCFRDRAFANVYACLFEDSLYELDFEESELAGLVRINAKKALEIIEGVSLEAEVEESAKEDGEIIVNKSKKTIEDFLVNKGENTSQKYGNVLRFIINEMK